LQPTFELRKFPSEQAGFDVLKVMLQQFAALLQSFVGPTVTFINTQGTLAPVKQSWHNELHPSDDGYNTFADMFHAKLKQMFPARIV
jgi:lysophospholipase L1-like esterase